MRLLNFYTEHSPIQKCSYFLRKSVKIIIIGYKIDKERQAYWFRHMRTMFLIFWWLNNRTSNVMHDTYISDTQMLTSTSLLTHDFSLSQFEHTITLSIIHLNHLFGAFLLQPFSNLLFSLLLTRSYASLGLLGIV